MRGRQQLEGKSILSRYSGLLGLLGRTGVDAG